MKDWDSFKSTYKYEAIDKIFREDSKYLVEVIREHSVGTDANGEYAKEILWHALEYVLYQNDSTVGEEEVFEAKRNLDSSIEEAPFFDDIIDYKLNEMWDSDFGRDEEESWD